MGKYLIILAIGILLSSCGTQRSYCDRKKAKVARILKDCPSMIDTVTVTDTIYKTDSVFLFVNKVIDSIRIDSLLSEYCTTDTIIQKEIIRKVIFRECENLLNGNYEVLTNNGDLAQVEIKGRDIKVFYSQSTIVKKERIIVPCEDKGFWWFAREYGMLFILVLMIGVIIGFNLRK